MMAGVRTVVTEDITSKVVGLETKFGGLEKNVSDLTVFVRNENSQIRRDMADQTASIRNEMASQTTGVLNAIEKLSQTAASSNNAVRTEFAADIKALSDKQGLKSGTLIALGVLALGAITYLQAQNNKPTESALASVIKTLERHETAFVPASTIQRMQSQIDRHEGEIVTREEHKREEQISAKFEAREEKARERAETREDKLRDRIYDLQMRATESVQRRTIERLDGLDARARAVEQKTAK